MGVNMWLHALWLSDLIALIFSFIFAIIVLQSDKYGQSKPYIIFNFIFGISFLLIPIILIIHFWTGLKL